MQPPPPPQQHHSGRIANFDPMGNQEASQPRANFNSPYSVRQSSTVIYTSDRGAGKRQMLLCFFPVLYM
jgi:hypothetical protein